MKKLLGVSIVALLAVNPMMASAADAGVNGKFIPAGGSATSATNTTSNVPYYDILDISDAEKTNLASAGYVKGAYNTAIRAVNEVHNLAQSAASSALSAAQSAQSAADTANSHIGDFSGLEAGTAATLVEAVNAAYSRAGQGQTEANVKALITAGAGNGLVSTTSGVVDVNAGNGIALVDDKVTVKAEDGTISVTSSGVKVGTITDTNIGTSAVTTAKINSKAVTTEKINDSAVGTLQIAQSAVTAAKLADGAVLEDKIGSKAVTTAKIADSAVDSLQIATSAVTADKLGDGAVVTGKIADSAVTFTKINSAAYVSGNIAESATASDTKLATEKAIRTAIDASVANQATQSGVVATIKTATTSTAVSVPVFQEWGATSTTATSMGTFNGTVTVSGYSAQ